jgi:hypothetical protein
MAVVLVAKVLDHADEFERRLAEFYRGLALKTAREGVRLLTDHMSRHRQRTRIVLAILPSGKLHRMRSSHLRYEPHLDHHLLEIIDLGLDPSASEVLDLAIRCDECLVGLYRQVVEQPIDQEVRELFEILIRRECCDMVMLKKIKAMDYF